MKSTKVSCYLPFAVNTVKRNMAYRGAFFIRLVSRFFTVLVTYYLWKAIFQSSTSSEIQGFTFAEMTVYIAINFLTGIITGISGPTALNIATDVADGSIAIQLIRPISYRLIKFSENMGDLVGNFLVQVIPFFIFFVIIGFSGRPAIFNLILYFFSAFLSFLCMFYFGFFFGLFSFYTTYFFGLNMAMSVLLQFFSGALIPLSFFPEKIEKIFQILPFASMNYTPLMLYLGKMDLNEGKNAIILQIFWILIFYLAGKVMWHFSIKKLTILGG